MEDKSYEDIVRQYTQKINSEKKSTKIKQIKISIIISLSVVLIPALIIGIIGFKQDLDKKKQKAAEEARLAAEEARLAAQVEVPNIIGMTADEAKKALNDIGLQINIYDYDKKLTDEKPDEYVVDKQYPSAKEKVDPNTEVKVFFKESMVVESNNFYGMRFKKTISEFCELYNRNIETIYDYLGENKTAIELDKIKESDFSYYMTVEATKCKEYVVNKIGYSIVLFTEPDSEYIVYACPGFDASKVANSDKMLTFILQKVYPATVMSLTGTSYSDVINNIKKVAEYGEKNNGVCILFKDNTVYHFSDDGNLNYFYIYAMSEEKYNQIMNGENKNQTSSDDQEIITDIKNRLNVLNGYYSYNFKPTEEQMQILVELAKGNGENFDSDMLENFLITNGWVSERGGSEPAKANTTSQSTTTNSNKSNTKSNSNNSSSSTKQETTSTTTTPTTSDNKSTSSNQSKSNKSEEKTTTETNESKPLSAIVRVNVHNTDSSKKYEYVGKSVKVMLNNETREDNYFNGDGYTATFLNVSTPKATIKVYIDGNLVKTQQADIETLAKQGNYYTDVDVNI